MANSIDINAWQQVPNRVTRLFPEAVKIAVQVEAAAKEANVVATSAASWDPDEVAGGGLVAVWTSTKLANSAIEQFEKQFADSQYTLAFYTLGDARPNIETDILVKRGTAIPGLKHIFETGNKALLGPTPLSNGIVSGLMLGGLGYGAGALGEQLFPARYLERGKLRRNLGRLGMLAGAGIGLTNAYSNAQALKEPFLKSLFTKNTAPVTYPFQKESNAGGYGYNPAAGIPTDDAAGLYSPSVPVPQFNTALWRDVQRGMINPYGPYGSHTPPPLAAAATGLMSGLSTGLNSPVIRPIDVIRGIASAGVGLATANVAGRALSALAGLTPEAQNHLQNLGLWGGMLHAVIPPIFRV